MTDAVHPCSRVTALGASLPEAARVELQSAFRMFDMDDSGEIDVGELREGA